MTSEGHAVCFKRCVHVSTCDSCFLPVLKFPHVRTWFPRKSTVCRSTFYWLLPNSRPNNKGPTAIWQAGLAGWCTWTSQTVCVGANTQRDTSAFSAKWAHTNRDKKCPITLEEREAIITWNSKTKMLTLRVSVVLFFRSLDAATLEKRGKNRGSDWEMWNLSFRDRVAKQMWCFLMFIFLHSTNNLVQNRMKKMQEIRLLHRKRLKPCL